MDSLATQAEPKSRRRFILLLAGSACTAALPLRGVHASKPASRQLLDGLGQCAWTRDGSSGGQKVMYILFEPTCPYARRQYADSRHLLGQSEFRWIPFANRTEVSQGATIRLSRTRSQDDLDRIMRSPSGPEQFRSYAAQWPGVVSNDPKIAYLITDILPKVRMFSGGSIGSPTSVFENNSGSVRLVRGAWAASHYGNLFD